VVPAGLVRVARAVISTCETVSRSGVYSGQLVPGKCVLTITPNLLSVTMSPLDAYPLPNAVSQMPFFSMRIVKKQDVVVGIWYDNSRRADAARILASIRPI
jgi:hypothetical protein